MYTEATKTKLKNLAGTMCQLLFLLLRQKMKQANKTSKNKEDRCKQLKQGRAHIVNPDQEVMR